MAGASVVTVIAAGLIAFALSRPGMPQRVRWGLVATAAVAIGGGSAVLGIGILLALTWMVRRHQSRRRADHDARTTLIRLADLVALGLSSGLTPAGALREAALELPDAFRGDVDRLLRRTAVSGVALAFATWEGWGERLFRLMARAVMTGAPLVGAVEAFASERRHEEHTLALASARRLPVKLLVPLALLILPGFVILVVGPALARSLARLDVVP